METVSHHRKRRSETGRGRLREASALLKSTSEGTPQSMHHITARKAKGAVRQDEDEKPAHH